MGFYFYYVGKGVELDYLGGTKLAVILRQVSKHVTR